MAVLIYILSVNLDSLGVGISYGLRKVHIPHVSSLIVVMLAVFYATIALYAGAFLAKVISPESAALLGNAILFLLGVAILVDSVRINTNKRSSRSFSIKPLGITISIIRNPVVCDFDNSNKIDAKEALYLGLALSLDSLAAGIGAGLTGISFWFLPPVIGAAQFLFLTIGAVLGEHLAGIKNISPKVWSAISGILLMTLALFRFFV